MTTPNTPLRITIHDTAGGTLPIQLSPDTYRQLLDMITADRTGTIALTDATGEYAVLDVAAISHIQQEAP
ncbi:hypothetical protein [Hamadaea tsunoensis]|uniref:hypothetical protein n=1 Tax=Hamadaea tsunoensis TaxID=53368 RepID=UPI0004007B73|nr:hypothetical protein [Hamadaea tsunoensis]